MMANVVSNTPVSNQETTDTFWEHLMPVEVDIEVESYDGEWNDANEY